ncbi:hypothetical protein AB0300_06190 [Microbacterium sp. NPDC078814]|jgi:hypothetical protein|uniref:hypothetical protein n=1 Tax=Microbacterium sp. NPDC078814 TaxID=3154767 RepID=UPI00344D7047
MSIDDVSSPAGARAANEREEVRARLKQAADDLLEGRVAGPLTGVRLVEVAGVKRHRLTHDNPELARAFLARAREINRTKPEVERLRASLDKERVRNRRLIRERDALAAQAKAYAAALLIVTEERDRLRSGSGRAKVTPIR